MSDTIISLILTSIVTLITFFVAQSITVWMNKRKVVDDSDLSRADLARKYLELANLQADENAGLETENQKKELEKKDLVNKYEILMGELKTMEARHSEEIEELRTSFEKERRENLLWKDWARRLALQVQSYGQVPVPFNPDELIKKNNAPTE